MSTVNKAVGRKIDTASLRTEATKQAADKNRKNAGIKQKRKTEMDDIFSLASAPTKNVVMNTANVGDGQIQVRGSIMNAELQEVADKVKKAREEKLMKSQAGQVVGIGSSASTKKARVEGSKEDLFGREVSKGRKRTEEGYAIYTEEELGLSNNSKGGDTDLCPFDCQCCF
ncbi:hypothetical protein CEUSTIGMA_g9037.t1 [Chlamydomonas eustigma]|uniref:DUF1764 domain-containing protein n=1 Tax=Chlamydomonas eustigma TaxID=1157962 RepID=A0A250XFC3_9CHLO|nr:hypothetical protein CEUSTIGMA_g9037.t1 [Chlamydomonas eustigma]|eukprot:GAX81609.1 hypothetical protein CEUSTIGMA_g9037.t1 [Chlamydomonas eustigma]